MGELRGAGIARLSVRQERHRPRAIACVLERHQKARPVKHGVPGLSQESTARHARRELERLERGEAAQGRELEVENALASVASMEANPPRQLCGGVLKLAERRVECDASPPRGARPPSPDS